MVKCSKQMFIPEFIENIGITKFHVSHFFVQLQMFQDQLYENVNILRMICKIW